MEKSINAVPRIDYEGSDYQQSFWTANRAYEDQAERIALTAMVPKVGRRIVEIGAGAGRLGDLYLGYDEIVLVDYAHTQLQQARARWGHDPRFVFVQGDIYRLPFPTDHFDTVVTVRVLHHLKDLGAALREIARITKRGGYYVTEFANKRNAKAILRYALGRGKPGENPFSAEPFEFVPLNIDHHPRHVRQELETSGFEVETERGVSFFRLGAVKRLIPASLLARADGLLQVPGASLRLTPSIFLRSRLRRAEERGRTSSR
jgi:ubiquinone/menaquinone biosynthesis C-methylase UbiE